MLILYPLLGTCVGVKYSFPRGFSPRVLRYPCPHGWAGAGEGGTARESCRERAVVRRTAAAFGQHVADTTSVIQALVVFWGTH